MNFIEILKVQILISHNLKLYVYFYMHACLCVPHTCLLPPEITLVLEL